MEHAEFYATVAQLIPVYLAAVALYARAVNVTPIRTFTLVLTGLASFTLLACLFALAGDHDYAWLRFFVWWATAAVVGVGASGLLMPLFEVWPRQKADRSEQPAESEAGTSES